MDAQRFRWGGEVITGEGEGGMYGRGVPYQPPLCGPSRHPRRLDGWIGGRGWCKGREGGRRCFMYGDFRKRQRGGGGKGWGEGRVVLYARTLRAQKTPRCLRVHQAV